MYCYIQEIQMKSSNSVGEGKELCVTETNWSMNGIAYTSYGYTYSDDKFERTVNTAYKISIHGKSYRNDKGQVRKKQYYLATIKYYDLIDYGWCGCIIENMVDDIATEMEIESELVWDEITKKLDALNEKINAEFELTDEYKAKTKHDAIIAKYQESKIAFAKKYEVDKREYDRCYDVFGELRNKEYLTKIKREYKARKEYEEKSRSYQQDYYSNYNKYSGNTGTSVNSGLDIEKNKVYYKKFYRVLAQKFHPDVTGENETMKIINELKEEWGV